MFGWCTNTRVTNTQDVDQVESTDKNTAAIGCDAAAARRRGHDPGDDAGRKGALSSTCACEYSRTE